jgi:hypothetical protein
MIATTRFRYIGITDERTVCDFCGKIDLKSTVVLVTRDADGNDEKVVYYGSTHAARALGRDGRGASRKVLDEARIASKATIRAADEARKQLAGYGLPESGSASVEQLAHAAHVYAEVHHGAHWSRRYTTADWMRRVFEMIARRQQQIADAVLIGR